MSVDTNRPTMPNCCDETVTLNGGASRKLAKNSQLTRNSLNFVIFQPNSCAFNIAPKSEASVRNSSPSSPDMVACFWDADVAAAELRMVSIDRIGVGVREQPGGTTVPEPQPVGGMRFSPKMWRDPRFLHEGVEQ